MIEKKHIPDNEFNEGEIQHHKAMSSALPRLQPAKNRKILWEFGEEGFWGMWVKEGNQKIREKKFVWGDEEGENRGNQEKKRLE